MGTKFWAAHKLLTHRNTFKQVASRSSLNSVKNVESLCREKLFPFSAFFPFFQSSKFLKIVENSEFQTNNISANIQFKLLPW